MNDTKTIMKEQYFLIINSEGDTTVEAMDKEELLKRLEDGDYGSERKCLTEIPKDYLDTNYWGETMLIIKGKVVTPKAKRL